MFKSIVLFINLSLISGCNNLTKAEHYQAIQVKYEGILEASNEIPEEAYAIEDKLLKQGNEFVYMSQQINNLFPSADLSFLLNYDGRRDFMSDAKDFIKGNKEPIIRTTLMYLNNFNLLSTYYQDPKNHLCMVLLRPDAKNRCTYLRSYEKQIPSYIAIASMYFIIKPKESKNMEIFLTRVKKYIETKSLYSTSISDKVLAIKAQNMYLSSILMLKTFLRHKNQVKKIMSGFKVGAIANLKLPLITEYLSLGQKIYSTPPAQSYLKGHSALVRWFSKLASVPFFYDRKITDDEHFNYIKLILEEGKAFMQSDQLDFPAHGQDQILRQQWQEKAKKLIFGRNFLGYLYLYAVPNWAKIYSTVKQQTLNHRKVLQLIINK